MKTWTVRQRILWSFGVIIALVAVMGVTTFIYLFSVTREADSLAKDSIPGLYYIAQIQHAAVARFAMAQEYSAKVGTAEREAIETRIRNGQHDFDAAVQRYETSIVQQHDRDLFEAVKVAGSSYQAAEAEILNVG